MASESQVFSDTGKEFPTYGRSNSATSLKLSTALAARYGVQRCIVTQSGMSAISTTLHGLIATSTLKFKLLHFSELYTDTIRLLRYFEIIYKHKLSISEFSTVDELNALVNEIVADTCSTDAIIVFGETASNPNGFEFPFEAVSVCKARCPGLTFTTVVDNTWASSVLCNPFKYGADIVVTSLTKYYSGGTTISGAILGSTANLNTINNWHCVMGNHVSPAAAQAVLDGLDTIDKRVTAASAATAAILCDLDELEISHPMCRGPLKYLTGPPPVFTVSIAGLEASVLFKMATDAGIEIKTSFGGPRCRIDNWTKKDGSKLVFRVAIGYEETATAAIVEFLTTKKKHA